MKIILKVRFARDIFDTAQFSSKYKIIEQVYYAIAVH